MSFNAFRMEGVFFCIIWIFFVPPIKNGDGRMDFSKAGKNVRNAFWKEQIYGKVFIHIRIRDRGSSR